MRRESELARLAWLNRIPIAMSSGRINRNVSNCLGETVGGWRERSSDEDRSPNMCLIAWSVFGSTRAIGWHRTTKANVGSHLYGVPQGWDPHIFGSERTRLGRISPSDQLWSRRPHDPMRVPTELNGLALAVCFAAFQSSALLYLRALVRSGCRPAIPDGGGRACFHTRPVHSIEDGVYIKGRRSEPPTSCGFMRRTHMANQ